MLVLLAVIVVAVGAGDELSQGLEAFCDAFSLRSIGQMSMTNIEIDAQSVEPGLIDKRPQVRRLAHFGVGVLDANCDAGVTRVQRQMLERTEGGIALARVSDFPRAAHMQNHSRKRQ